MIWIPPVENWMRGITFYDTMRPSSHYASHPFDNYVSVVIATDVYSHITLGGVNEAVVWTDVKYMLLYCLDVIITKPWKYKWFFLPFALGSILENNWEILSREIIYVDILKSTRIYKDAYWGDRGVCLGVSAQGGVSTGGVCLGVSAQEGVCPGMGFCQTPPFTLLTEWLTDRCKTLPCCRGVSALGVSARQPPLPVSGMTEKQV